jgi:hypothetical protein
LFQDGSATQKQDNVSNFYYSVSMSVYHFRLAGECDADSEEGRFNYYCVKVYFSEVSFGIDNISVEVFGGVIERRVDAVLNKQYWFVIEGLNLKVMLKDIFSRVYFTVISKSKQWSNIDPMQTLLGYCSTSSSEDDWP